MFISQRVQNGEHNEYEYTTGTQWRRASRCKWVANYRALLRKASCKGEASYDSLLTCSIFAHTRHIRRSTYLYAPNMCAYSAYSASHMPIFGARYIRCLFARLLACSPHFSIFFSLALFLTPGNALSHYSTSEITRFDLPGGKQSDTYSCTFVCIGVSVHGCVCECLCICM